MPQSEGLWIQTKKANKKLNTIRTKRQELGDQAQPSLIASVQPARDASTETCEVFTNICPKILDDDKFDLVIRYLHTRTVAAVWKFIHKQLILANTGLRRVISEELCDQTDALPAIGDGVDQDDIKGAGQYADFVTSDDDPTYIKAYVGQSTSLRQRIDDHHRDPRKTSVHWQIHGCENRTMSFVLLGQDTDRDIPQEPALLDLVEMYFACLLQTMQPANLKAWFPTRLPLRRQIGLNVALPLLQSYSKGPEAQRSRSQLWESSDPEIRDISMKSIRLNMEQGIITMAEQGYTTVAKGARLASKSPKRDKIRRSLTPDE